MSIIPDCRTDECYNEKYLNENDSQCVIGYDFSVKDNIEGFFNNITNYEDDIAEVLGIDEVIINQDILDSNKDIDDYTEEELQEMGTITALLTMIKQRMLFAAESNRDEMITSMIENMNDSEYESLKAKVDNGEHKNAIIRQREYEAKYEAGEVPTYWTFERAEDGKCVKIGHCPNGTTIVELISKDGDTN